MINSDQEYRLKRQLKKAIWLLNSVDLAFRTARKVEEISFTRVSSSPDEIHKIFLSELDRQNGVKFITESEKLLKEIENANLKEEMNYPNTKDVWVS